MLTLYPKELFSKLRFSYVEQVTKEKFLRAIVGDPPLVVGHNENVEMEAQLAEVKADLRARKEEVRSMVEEMEKTGKDLANSECFLPIFSAVDPCPWTFIVTPVVRFLTVYDAEQGTKMCNYK